ncbi:MAG: oxidoreductase [Magnetovibrio sp.]|nr:oxidoreductase [Magnetovibrio sp.]
MSDKVVLIVGAGSGLSAAIARRCAARGMAVQLAARTTEKLSVLAKEIDAAVFRCDASKVGQVAALFDQLDNGPGIPDLVVYNPSYRQRAPFIDLDPNEVYKALMVTCYGGFLVGQHAAKRMLTMGQGSIFFTGASASVKGYIGSAPFAMGKFGLRGLVQSMAREFAPKNIHVAHFIIDGGIESEKRVQTESSVDDSLLNPDAIADTYMHVYDQPRSAWTWELELRPWVEKF